MSGDRKARLRKILEIVATRAIETQEELADALAAEGFEVTQSSVSRDVAELGLVKIEGVYVRAPAGAPVGADPNERRVARGVLQVDVAGPHLVVLHTAPAEANAVAIAIDRLAWSGIAGTIAGDDTVFVAVGGTRDQKALLKELRRLNPGL
jgi:transcriptional regulator of arginine metabolism